MRSFLLVAVGSAAAGALLGCASGPPQVPPDPVCLAALRSRGVEFAEGPSLKGVRTPVTVNGDSLNPRLRARAGRPAQMDCQLAVALVEAAPIFRSYGITELDFSGAYDYRNRRRSSKLSAHAAGLAIDVHVFHTSSRQYVVASSFERRPAAWRSLELGRGGLSDCVANPRTARGRTLRSLACQLRLENAFRVIITPDDNWDHHDHFHLEAPPNFTDWMPSPVVATTPSPPHG
jgi:hypothetical protein